MSEEWLCGLRARGRRAPAPRCGVAWPRRQCRGRRRWRGRGGGSCRSSGCLVSSRTRRRTACCACQSPPLSAGGGRARVRLATAEKQGQNRPRQGSRAGVCEWRAVGLAGAVRCPSVSVTPVSRRKGKQSHHPQCHQQAKQPHGRGAAWQAQQPNSKSAEDERVAIPLWSGSVITHAHTRSHHSKSDHKVSGTRKAEKTAEVKLTTLKGKTQEGQQEGCLAVFAQGCRAPRRP